MLQAAQLQEALQLAEETANENAEAQERVAAVSAEIEALQTRGEADRAQLEEALRQSEEAAAEVARLVGETRRFEEERKRLTLDASQARERSARDNAIATEARERSEERERAYDKLKADQARLEHEVESLKKHLDALSGKASGGADGARVRKLEATLQAEREKLAEVRGDMTMALVRAAEADRLSKRLEQLQRRAAELERVAMRVDTLESDNTVLQRALREAEHGASEPVAARRTGLRALSPTLPSPPPVPDPPRPSAPVTVPPPLPPPPVAAAAVVSLVPDKAPAGHSAPRRLPTLDGPATKPPAARTKRLQRLERLSRESLEGRLKAFMVRDEHSSETLDRYLADFPIHVRGMREAAGAGEIGNIEVIANRLHGQFLDLGAQKLSDIASHIELATSSGELAEVPELIDALEVEFTRIRPRIEAARREL